MCGFIKKSILLTLFLLLIPTLANAYNLSSIEAQAISHGQRGVYIWLGTKHILTGIGHLLFIFGMVFLLQRVSDILLYALAFAIAHSFSLMWATFYYVPLNYFFVDSLIALSILYIAMANLDAFRKILRMPTPNMIFSTIIFGMIHGLSMSEQLHELPMPNDELLINMLLYNVGIEFGLAISLGCMVIWLSVFRKCSCFKFFHKLSNVALIVMSVLILFTELSTFQLQHLSRNISAQMHTDANLNHDVDGNESQLDYTEIRESQFK